VLYFNIEGRMFAAGYDNSLTIYSALSAVTISTDPSPDVLIKVRLLFSPYVITKTTFKMCGGYIALSISGCVRKIPKSDYYLRHVRPPVRLVRLSVRMKQLGSHWADFQEIWYLSIF
jgi:hypothetical protein